MSSRRSRPRCCPSQPPRRRSTTRPTFPPRNSARARPGVREDRRQRRRRRPGRAPDGGLHPPAPAQHLLLPLRHRDARRVPAARRPDEEGHYLPAASKRAARGRRRTVLSADDVELVKRMSGADDVAPVEAMATAGWPLALGRRRPPVAGEAAAAAPRRRHLRRVQPGRESGPEPRRAGLGRDRARQRLLGRGGLAAAALRRAAARAAAARRRPQPQPDPRRDAQHQERARDRDAPARSQIAGLA